MKTAFVMFFATCLSALATGWDDRVNHYCGKVVSPDSWSVGYHDGVPSVGDNWDESLTGKPKPTIAQLTATPDAVIDAWDESSAAQARKAQSMAAIKSASESNLVALAASVGVTNQPIDWVTLQAIGDQMVQQAKAVQATNTLAGLLLRVDALELQQKVAVLYDFYVGNGGDPRKAGKKTK